MNKKIQLVFILFFGLIPMSNFYGQYLNTNDIGNAYCWGPKRKFSEISLVSGVNNTYVSKSKESAIGYNLGIYSEHFFKKSERLKWKVGVMYSKINLSIDKPFCFNELESCELPDKTVDNFDIVEIPFVLKYHAIPWRRYFVVNFYGGYSIGRIINYHTNNYYNDQITKSELKLHGLTKTIHQAILGAEIEYLLNPTISFHLSASLKITNIYDQKYGDLYTTGLHLGVGKRF